MRGSLRIPLLLALAAPPALPSLAESTRGSILDPTGGDTTRVVEPRGMSWIRPLRRRTPTGFLYPYPLEPQTLLALDEEWKGGASLDIGGLATTGDDDETRFWRYADWGSNFLLNSFRLTFLQERKGLYAEARGGAVGREDQFYSAEFSWLGRARLRGSFSGLPRAYARDARSLYEGLGSDTLTLLPGLTAGGLGTAGETDAALISKLETVGESHLSVQRNQGQVEFDAWLRPDTRFFARYRAQQRRGERPFGGSWLYPTEGYTSARAVETVEPIRDKTYEVSTGISLHRDRFDANLRYTGSFYRNANDSLTWDNPFLLPGFTAVPPNGVKYGRFALAPDNDWHNVKGDFALSLPMRGRLTATASWSQMSQDEDLLPPTVNSGTVGLVNLDEWNTQSALARNSADNEVQTLLLRGDIRFRPWKALQFGARVRYFDREDKSEYTACNPSTGEAGYVTEDGALAGFFDIPGHQVSTAVCGGSESAASASEDFRYRATPYGYDQLKAEGFVNARLQQKTNLGVRYAWERKGYDHRERKHTTEQRVRGEFSNRQLSWATIRLSYLYAKRDGSSYQFDPYSEYYASSLNNVTVTQPQAFTLAQFRKYDLADRVLQRANLRWNFLLRDDMDLALSGQFRDVDYGSDYGLRDERGGGLNLEWNWQPSPKWNAYLMGSWERSRRKLTNIAGVYGSNDPEAGGIGYPLLNAWEVKSHQDTGFAGAGVSGRLFERWIVKLGYRFVTTRQKIDYDYATDGALAIPTTAAEAGHDFPDLKTTHHILENSVRFEATEHLALRFFHIYQRGEIEDFQQAGLDDPTLVNDQLNGQPLGAGTLFLGHVDRKYTAHVFGATLQLRY